MGDLVDRETGKPWGIDGFTLEVQEQGEAD